MNNNDNVKEYLYVDDNNYHNGEGVKYATFKKTKDGRRWLVCEVEEGFSSEDKMLQDLVDEFVHEGIRSYYNVT